MKTDFTAEYRHLIDMMCATNPAKDELDAAYKAMGFAKAVPFSEALSVISEKYDISGTSFESSSCFLKGESRDNE